MNSFFYKVKDFFKRVGSHVQNAVKVFGSKIAKFAAKTKQYIKSVFANIRKEMVDAFRLFKSTLKRPKKETNSDVEQNLADSSGEADFTQSENREPDFSASETSNSQHAETETSDKTKTDEAEAQHKNDRRKYCGKTRCFFIHAADILAGLLFFSAVVIALKPELLGSVFQIPNENYQNDMPHIVKKTGEIGGYLIKVKIITPVSPELEIARNTYIVIFLTFYVILKIIVLLFVKNQTSQKIVAVLMVALTILTCTLLAENFLIFSSICLIASFAFAFSCGFPMRTIFRKFIIFVIIALCYYVVAHILIDYGNCKNILKNARLALSCFGIKILEFFKILKISLPL